MMNQIKLNLNVVRWVLIVTGITLVVNISYMIVDNRLIGWLSGILTLISVVALLLTVLEYHRKYKMNESYRVYFTMPVKKMSLIQADYLCHIILIMMVTVVTATWMTATDQFYLYYALFMITGLSLIISSIYLYQYAKHWFKVVTNAIFSIYIIPFVLMMMFYIMPLMNTFNDGLDLGAGWMFFLTKVPFIIFAAGVIMNVISYIKAKQLVLKTDID